MDSTFIESPSSTENQNKQRKPKAHSAKKENELSVTKPTSVWIARMIPVHTVKVTSANVHDVTGTADLLPGEEKVVYGDSGYLGADKRLEALKRTKDVCFGKSDSG